jgi:hypothetical protein
VAVEPSLYILEVLGVESWHYSHTLSEPTHMHYYKGKMERHQTRNGKSKVAC